MERTLNLATVGHAHARQLAAAGNRRAVGHVRRGLHDQHRTARERSAELLEAELHNLANHRVSESLCSGCGVRLAEFCLNGTIRENKSDHEVFGDFTSDRRLLRDKLTTPLGLAAVVGVRIFVVAREGRVDAAADNVVAAVRGARVVVVARHRSAARRADALLAKVAHRADVLVVARHIERRVQCAPVHRVAHLESAWIAVVRQRGGLRLAQPQTDIAHVAGTLVDLEPGAICVGRTGRCSFADALAAAVADVADGFYDPVVARRADFGVDVCAALDRVARIVDALLAVVAVFRRAGRTGAIFADITLGADVVVGARVGVVSVDAALGRVA